MGVMFPEEMSGIPEVDEETGLAVCWLRDEPARENVSYFALIIDEKQIPFSASYQQATAIIMQEQPGIRATEAWELSRKDNRVEFTASEISADFDRQIFVSVWHRLIKRAMPSKKVRVAYREGSALNGQTVETWEIDGTPNYS